MGPQHHQDDRVRYQKEKKPDEDQHSTVGDHEALQEGGVSAGESQHLWDITVEVVQFIGDMEGQLDHQCDLCDRVDEAPTPTGQNQLKAQLVVHDCQVLQRTTYGNIPIIGHVSRNISLAPRKCKK